MKRSIRFDLTRTFRNASVQAVLGIGLLALLTLSYFALQRGWFTSALLSGTARWEARPEEMLQRVSLSRLGVEGNLDSFAPSISADGRYVVFLSIADNLVDGDTNGYQDVFLYDREANEVTRISVGVEGQEANGISSDARISSDGNYVVFVSEASNLVVSDTNHYVDVFLYERTSGALHMISVSPDGVQGDDRSLQPAISADGSAVAFVSLSDSLSNADVNGFSDIYVYNVADGSLDLISVSDDGQQAEGTNKYPAISADGRFVAFQSKAANLAAGDNGQTYDIFVRDRQEGHTELISFTPQGGVGNLDSQRPSISDDGRFVAFESWASNLLEGDANNFSDVFVTDRVAGTVQIVSVSNDKEQANHVNGGAVISGDGRTIAFSSMASNLVTNDFNGTFDVYVHDRIQSNTSLVSINLRGEAANGTSISPSLSAGGNNIVFDSLAADLVSNDTNERLDVFIFRGTHSTETERHTLYMPLMMTP